MFEDYNTIESCIDRWTGGESPRAGQTMAKALRKVGLSVNPTGTSADVKVYCGWDSFYVPVPVLRVPEMVAALWADTRTTKVEVDGEDRPKPEKAKTIEDVQKEFDAFKKKVLEVALKTKREEDWCNPGFKRVMEEDLGLEVPSTKVRVVLELDLDDHDTTIMADDTWGVRDFVGDMTSYDLREAIKSVEPIKD